MNKRDTVIAQRMNATAARYAEIAKEHARDGNETDARRMASAVRGVYFCAKDIAQTLYPEVSEQQAFMRVVGAGIPEALGEIAAMLKTKTEQIDA